MAINQTNITVRLLARNEQLAKDLKKAEKRLGRFSGRVNKIGSQIQASFAGMFGIFAAAQFGRKVIGTLADFEFQMSKVKAISGATADELEDLKNNALELGRASKFTAVQIGSLQEEFARLGFSTDSILRMTDATRQLATVANSELGEAALSVGKSINAFNLEATDAGTIANIMAESFTKSALDLQKFDVAMGNVGAAAKAAGFSFAETTSLLGILVDSGIDASKAGTDLRKIFTEIALKGSTLEKELTKLVLSEDKLTTSYDQFGQRALTSAIILSNNIERHKEFTKTLEDNNRQLSEMVKTMEGNLTTDFLKLESALDGLILKGSKLNPILRGLTQAATNVLLSISLSSADQQKAHEMNVTLSEFIDLMAKLQKIEDENPTGAQASIIPGLSVPKFKVVPDAVKDPLMFFDESLLTNEEKITNDALDFINRLEDVFASFGEGDDISPDLDFSEQIAADMERNLKAARDGMDDLTQSQIESVELMENLNQTVERVIEDAISSFVSQLAFEGIEAGFTALFDVIGTGLQLLGKALIAFGVSIDAFQKAFTNPFVAIGAGIAAIAAGSLVKKHIAGLSSVGNSGGNYVSGGSITSPSVNVNGEFIVRGTDLVYVLNQQNNRNARTNGG